MSPPSRHPVLEIIHIRSKSKENLRVAEATLEERGADGRDRGKAGWKVEKSKGRELQGEYTGERDKVSRK